VPTPTGLLRAGDKLRYKATGEIYVVVRREGNDVAYSVILRPLEGKLPKGIHNTVTGMPNTFRLLEAAYWIREHGPYELVK